MASELERAAKEYVAAVELHRDLVTTLERCDSALKQAVDEMHARQTERSVIVDRASDAWKIANRLGEVLLSVARVTGVNQ